MDLGPLAGIRAISLLNAQKMKAEESPHFEIDASARAGDEHASNQHAPDRKPEKDVEFIPQAAAADQDDDAGSEATGKDAPSPEDAPKNGFDWFV